MADMTDAEQKLDALLEQMRRTEPELPGDDFTTAVMRELPPDRAMQEWQHNALLLGATALASAIIAWQMEIPSVATMTTALLEYLPRLLGASAALTWGAAAVGIWAALQR
jgi:hypothetical protein